MYREREKVENHCRRQFFSWQTSASMVTTSLLLSLLLLLLRGRLFCICRQKILFCIWLFCLLKLSSIFERQIYVKWKWRYTFISWKNISDVTGIFFNMMFLWFLMFQTNFIWRRQQWLNYSLLTSSFLRERERETHTLSLTHTHT